MQSCNGNSAAEKNNQMSRSVDTTIGPRITQKNSAQFNLVISTNTADLQSGLRLDGFLKDLKTHRDKNQIGYDRPQARKDKARNEESLPPK